MSEAHKQRSCHCHLNKIVLETQAKQDKLEDLIQFLLTIIKYKGDICFCCWPQMVQIT